MCGIVARIASDPGVARASGAEAIRVLAHRGPDDDGSWSDEYAWLGHRRLSIIDLSSGGHQPMVHQPSGVVITYGGEIYNYLELRSELEDAGHRFRTRSDTEVLLAAYVEWGAACLPRLNGMWSFLIWDPRSHSAFFARDRLGVKPFYFAFVEDGLSIASEPKALLTLHPTLRRVDETALYGFLAEGELYTGARSFYDGINVLEAGHCGTFAPGNERPNIRRYWAPPVDSSSHADAREPVEQFGALLHDAVRLRMRSDVPIGFTLSGGLDSSAILQAAASAVGPAAPRLHAFTSVYANPPGARIIDERHWAGVVAARFVNVDLEQVPAGDTDWLGVLERIAWHMDGPGYSPAVFPLWRIMERARARGIPVLLEGQGADELLGGYPQYAALALWESLARLQLETFARDFQSYARTFPARLLALWLVRERLPFVKAMYRQRVGALGAIDPEFARRSRGDAPVRVSHTVNGRLRDDLTRDILPGLLQYGDAISMAHSVESRLPFLDYRLVELVVSMPSHLKVGRGETKRILRNHLRTVGLPEVANRRDKQGYPTPADAWLRANNGAILRSVLLSPHAAIRAYCTDRGLRRIVDHHVSGGRGSGNHLYRLLAAEIWLRTCITRTSRIPIEAAQATSLPALP